MEIVSNEEYLRVGIIQPIINENTVWPLDESENPRLKMNRIDANYINDQIRYAVNSFIDMKESDRPSIILLPELCAYEEAFIEELAKKSNFIIITGNDFITSEKNVWNKAQVFIPSNWNNPDITSKFCQKFFFGKKYFSYSEDKKYNKFGLTGVSSPEIYILNTNKYGRIGLAICADFFDIIRFRIYKGHIQHLFILALNKDTETFEHMAETISRMVFCNVVVCNTGFYGGSLAYSPYKDSYRRFIYLHRGSELYTSQVVSLPVSDLVNFQQKICDPKKRIFKSLPPGYKYPDYDI